MMREALIVSLEYIASIQYILTLPVFLSGNRSENSEQEEQMHLRENKQGRGEHPTLFIFGHFDVNKCL